MIGATSPVGSSELERAASGVVWLKNVLRNIMKDEQESNLNLLQVHTTGSINIEEILQMFIKNPERLFSPSLLFSKTEKFLHNFYFKF